MGEIPKKLSSNVSTKICQFHLGTRLRNWWNFKIPIYDDCWTFNLLIQSAMNYHYHRLSQILEKLKSQKLISLCKNWRYLSSASAEFKLEPNSRQMTDTKKKKKLNTKVVDNLKKNILYTKHFFRKWTIYE